jgi:hypothetical protein
MKVIKKSKYGIKKYRKKKITTNKRIKKILTTKIAEFFLTKKIITDILYK